MRLLHYPTIVPSLQKPHLLMHYMVIPRPRCVRFIFHPSLLQVTCKSLSLCFTIQPSFQERHVQINYMLVPRSLLRSKKYHHRCKNLSHPNEYKSLKEIRCENVPKIPPRSKTWNCHTANEYKPCPIKMPTIQVHPYEHLPNRDW